LWESEYEGKSRLVENMEVRSRSMLHCTMPAPMGTGEVTNARRSKKSRATVGLAADTGRESPGAGTEGKMGMLSSFPSSGACTEPAEAVSLAGAGSAGAGAATTSCARTGERGSTSGSSGEPARLASRASSVGSNTPASSDRVPFSRSASAIAELAAVARGASRAKGSGRAAAPFAAGRFAKGSSPHALSTRGALKRGAPRATVRPPVRCTGAAWRIIVCEDVHPCPTLLLAAVETALDVDMSAAASTSPTACGLRGR
jgi:hypothetical protein